MGQSGGRAAAATAADRATATRREAHRFVEAILHANRTPLDNVTLIVFETNEYAENRPWFAEALRLEQSDPAYPAFIRNMVVLDLSPVLTRDKYYVLDDHIRPEGHQIIADTLARVIRDTHEESNETALSRGSGSGNRSLEQASGA